MDECPNYGIIVEMVWRGSKEAGSGRGKLFQKEAGAAAEFCEEPYLACVF